MNYCELWNYLVAEYFRNRAESEDKIHTLWQSYLANPFMFSYSENGDVDSKRSLHIGSTNKEIPDLILRKDNKNLFVIELKQYSLPKTSNFEKQILNYMAHTDLRLPIGILVCEKLYIYYYEFASGKKFCVEIPFEKDNPNGEKFVKLFCKENFDTEKVKEFIISKAEQNDDISTIQSQLDSDLVKQLVKAHFSREYDEETIEKALSEYSFSVSSNKNTPVYSVLEDSRSDYPADYSSIKTDEAPAVILMIGDKEVRPNEFKQRLLETKVAKRFWYYNNGKSEDDIWNARNFKSDSDLLGNIHSTKYRHWKASGLVKLILIISEQ